MPAPLKHSLYVKGDSEQASKQEFVSSLRGFLLNDMATEMKEQYTSYIVVREKLVAEGWKYLELCDDYIEGNHKDNFTKFCERVENIKENQTEKESVFINENRKNIKNTKEDTDTNNYSNEENL